MRIIESGALPRRALLACFALAACAPAATPPAATAPTHPAAGSAPSRELAPGVTYTALHLAEGPWRGHLIEVTPVACGVEFRAAMGDEHAVGRERTSEMARRIA